MNTLVTDFDGTLTQHDFFELVRKRWPSPPGDDPWDEYVAGNVTHFEALALIFGRIRTSETILREMAAAMEIDPAAGGAVRQLKEHGWQVVVASAGAIGTSGNCLRPLVRPLRSTATLENLRLRKA